MALKKKLNSGERERETNWGSAGVGGQKQAKQRQLEQVYNW